MSSVDIEARWRDFYGRHFVVIFLSFQLLFISDVYGQSGDTELTDFAFANYIGSGIYRASGREVAALNIPFSYTPQDQLGYKMTWRLPVSLGYYDFDFDDIGDEILPHKADTLTFVPGVEWDIPITDDLLFRPYIDVGWGKNFTFGDDVLIYSSGVSSHYQFGSREKDHQWVNRILFARYRSLSDSGVSDGYASLQSGVDWRLLDGFELLGRESFVSVYGLAQWHFNTIEFVSPGQRTVTLENSYEVGFTLGLVSPLDFDLFELKRIGLGYRYGNGLRLWRLSFNTPL